MKTNDILFKIKTALSLDNESMIKAYALANYTITKERVENIVKRRQDKGYEEASFEELGFFWMVWYCSNEVQAQKVNKKMRKWLN